MDIQAPILVTDDQRLGKFTRENNLLHETPIQDQTRVEMVEWEKEHLPPAGLSRYLYHFYRYLLAKNADLAGEFKEDSMDFQSLPET
jgi:hypothetical protein